MNRYIPIALALMLASPALAQEAKPPAPPPAPASIGPSTQPLKPATREEICTRQAPGQPCSAYYFTDGVIQALVNDLNLSNGPRLEVNSVMNEITKQYTDQHPQPPKVDASPPSKP